MRIVEILLPRGVSDRSLSPQTIQKIDALQQRMNLYVDKIMDPKTSSAGKEFLKARLRDDFLDMKNSMAHIHAVAEAVEKLPLSDKDFDGVKKMMENPIPAVVAPIYISEFIIDDELSAQLSELEESNPGMDVRPLIVEWFDRVMPDQMYRFRHDEPTDEQRSGNRSLIHGYDSHSFKGTSDPITGNAFGYY